MIKSYYIHNFKNHADSSLEFGKLTILTGINGMGKSSVFQSMLLLRDSFNRNNQMEDLVLDGESCDVGSSADLVNSTVTNDSRNLKLEFKTDNGDSINFSFDYPTGNESSLSRAETSEHYAPQKLKEIALFTDNFQYLSAFRDGPRNDYGVNTNSVDKHRQISKRMGMGEFAVYYLSLYGELEIPIKNLQHDGISDLSLRTQVQAWLGEVSPNIQIKIDQFDKLKLSYGYKQEGRTTVYHSAMNTGFGISYILSIIVAILSAKPGALILIENPEAHIHPSGQSALMRLLCMAANAGVQIILETHSDHIINGALVNIKKNIICKADVSFYYFELDDNLNSMPIKLQVGENNRIKDAPDGFCDQIGIDLEEIYDL